MTTKRTGTPWMTPAEYGRTLIGLSLNLIVRDIAKNVGELQRLADSRDAAVAEDSHATGKEKLPVPIALDLLAQAEHAADASSVLITTSAELAQNVVAEIARQMQSLPRRAVVEESLRQYGAIVVVKDLCQACAIVNDLAPEHLEIVTRDDEAVAERVRHAGAIFFGSYTPEAVGDYFAGPNHVLPTAGAARFASALGVGDFVRRTSMLRYSREALQRSTEKIATLARAEGLDAHARSAEIRLE